jgi:hypothetical protein
MRRSLPRQRTSSHEDSQRKLTPSSAYIRGYIRGTSGYIMNTVAASDEMNVHGQFPKFMNTVAASDEMNVHGHLHTPHHPYIRGTSGVHQGYIRGTSGVHQGYIRGTSGVHQGYIRVHHEYSCGI